VHSAKGCFKEDVAYKRHKKDFCQQQNAEVIEKVKIYLEMVAGLSHQSATS